jgi:hypothetical protein
MQRDLVFGMMTLGLAVGYYVAAGSIPATLLGDMVGAQGLPRTYAVLLAVLSLVLIGRSLAPRRGVEARDRNESPTSVGDARAGPSRTWRPAALLAIGVAYILALPRLGYVLSLAGLILAATWAQGGALTRRSALVAACGAVFFWILFVLVLNIPQPGGWWAP